MTFVHLLARFGSAAQALEAIPALAARGGGGTPRLAGAATAEAEMEAVARLGARHIFMDEEDYPRLLDEVDGAPPVIIVKGQADLAQRDCVAMVGARNASAAACRFARQLAGQLGRADHVIVSGLARGTVVVEAAPRSGSLITARQAADYGREVMAVPGSPLDPRAQGCNQLIREGATLIQNAEDVIEAITPIVPGLRDPGAPYASAGGGDPPDTARSSIAGLLNATPVPVDELVRQSRLQAAVVQTVLLELELAGRLERHAGGKVSLLGPG